MSISELTPGIHKVKLRADNPVGNIRPFNLSVVVLHGARGVKAFDVGAKPPGAWEHLMLPVEQVKEWAEKLERI